MPTYEYRCNACEHQFEEFQSITAKSLRKCPECGKPKLERLIGTGAGIIFKGSGFYETDYRSDSYKKAADAEKSGGASGDKKSDDKPAKKTDTKKDKKSDSGSSSAGSRNNGGGGGGGGGGGASACGPSCACAS